MGQFKWDSTLDVHIPEMNREHQHLINLFNQVLDKVKANVPKTQIVQALKELEKFTQNHFQHEEAVFVSLPQYSFKESHKRLHEKLLNDLQQFIHRYEQQAESEFPKDFEFFLKNWLIGHIRGVDTTYGQEWLRAHKAS